MNDLKYNDRLFCAGPTGSGKSTLLNVLFSQLRCQRVLIDTKDEWAIDDVEIVRDPAAIDFTQPIIHYRGCRSLDEVDELFARLHRRRQIVVCVHELADLCDDQPNRAPGSLREYIRKGRAHGQGLLGGSQRPVGMPRQARTEAQHIVYVLPRLDPDDHQIVVKMCEGAGPGVIEAGLATAESLSPTGEHGFVTYSKRGRVLKASPPLPPHVLARSVVRSVTVA